MAVLNFISYHQRSGHLPRTSKKTFGILAQTLPFCYRSRLVAAGNKLSTRKSSAQDDYLQPIKSI